MLLSHFLNQIYTFLTFFIKIRKRKFKWKKSYLMYDCSSMKHKRSFVTERKKYQDVKVLRVNKSNFSFKIKLLIPI